MDKLRKERAVTNPQYPGYNFLGPAPALPDRYVKGKDLNKASHNLQNDLEELPEYLEPIPEPRESQSSAISNIGYNFNIPTGSAGGRNFLKVLDI